MSDLVSLPKDAVKAGMSSAGSVRALGLRTWQREALTSYLQGFRQGQRVALWEATPGAGKTRAALMLVRHQLKSANARSVLIVVPTAHLRTQWAQAAAELGLQLDSCFSGARAGLTADFQGAVVTYQQMGTTEQYFRTLAAQSVVILDEVHHAADGLSWGNALLRCLSSARYILCLSGTAFRSDSNPIPFINYDRDGVSCPEFSYSYARAVEEGVCRPTAFLTYGGDVSWCENDTVLSVQFADALDPGNSARRLRAALDPSTGWVQPMLRDAHEMLLATRREHANAAGLLVCADQTHARQMARLLHSVCGEKPMLVLSDDSAATKNIKHFSKSNQLWLVACNMVSEGVDIPRLRVGVYGTTIRTKMYFRQFLGRIVRRTAEGGSPQVAYFYLPADPYLHQLAEEIESEIKHCLHAKKDSLFGEDERASRRESIKTEPSWTPVSGFNSGVASVVLHGNQLSLFGASAAPEHVSAVIQQEVVQRQQQALTRSEIKQQLATQIKHLVAQMQRKSGKPHSVVHSTLNKLQSIRSQTHCTEQQLRQRIELLEKMLAD